MYIIPKKLIDFPWLDGWRAARLLLELLGVVGLVVWFRQPAPWWMIVPEAVLLGVALCICFLIVTELRARRLKRWAEMRLADPTHDRVRGGSRPHRDTPMMRELLVYIDPDTGNEVRKWEPA
jgi:hypothetical protein